LRTAFIAASFLAVVLYGIVLASWGHDWDYSQPLTFMIGFPTGKDFINLYAGGQIVSQSMDIKLLFSIEPYAKYLTELFNTNVHNYHYVWSYPPTMLLPARLFAGLPYLPAFALWSSATLAIFLGGLYLAGLRGWWLLAALLAPATAVNLFFGQYGYLLAGLLIGGLSLRDSRPILAGILLGLATIKPQLGLLLPILLLAQRQWWVIAAASATALLLLGLSLAVDGIEVWRHFIDFTLPLQRMFLEDGRGYFLFLTLTPFMAGKIVGVPLPALYAVQIGLALLCALGVYRMGRRGPPLRAVIFTFAATFMATPYAMAYDLTVLVGAGLLLLAARPGWMNTPRRAFAFVALWLLPLVGLSQNLLLVAGAPLVIALFTWQVWRADVDDPASACRV